MTHCILFQAINGTTYRREVELAASPVIGSMVLDTRDPHATALEATKVYITGSHVIVIGKAEAPVTAEELLDDGWTRE